MEIKTPKDAENFIFPIEDGTVKMSGGDQGIRKYTSMRDQPLRGEEFKDDLRGESDGSQPMDTMMDDRSPNDFLVDRRELYLSSSRRTLSSALCAERRIIANTTAIH